MKKIGAYHFLVLVEVLILLWLGIFKFTLTEAKAIEPLVSQHPAMSWLYQFGSLQTVSNLIGIAEIMAALALLAALYRPSTGRYAGPATALIFVTTLTFLWTTPGTWQWVEAVPTTDFFILKDLAFLGISGLVWEKSFEAPPATN